MMKKFFKGTVITAIITMIILVAMIINFVVLLNFV